VTLLIATVLTAIPLSLINTEPEITVVVNTLEIDANYGKPPGTPGGGGKPDKPDKGGGGKPGDYLLTGHKWENLEGGLTLHVGGGLEASVISASADEWDTNVAEDLVFEVMNGAGDVFNEWVSDNPDYINELIYASPPSFVNAGLNPARVIAVCITWYDPITGEIEQFDIAFNTYFSWGNADPDDDGVVENPTVMDVQNIATHELGHGFGLDDIYKRNLSYLTMYGYSDLGEIQKRTLAQGDKDGIQALYGLQA
jgi:hypothetical protein